MIVKTSFFILLGVALVASIPALEVKAESMEEKTMQEAWTKLDGKFNRAQELMKNSWEKVREKSEKLANTAVKNIQDKLAVLLVDMKKAAQHIADEVKDAAPQVKEIHDNIHQLIGDLRQVAREVVQIITQLGQQLYSYFKDKLVQLQTVKN